VWNVLTILLIAFFVVLIILKMCWCDKSQSTQI
jgi:hypothetical protein